MKTLYDGTQVSLDTQTRLVSGKRYLLTQDGIAEMAVADQIVEDARTSKEALIEIARLEVTITPRRIREALLTTDGKTWLGSVETLIEVERAKL